MSLPVLLMLPTRGEYPLIATSATDVVDAADLRWITENEEICS